MATTYCTKNASAIISPNGGFDAWSGYSDFIPIGTWASLDYKGRGFFYFPFDFSAATGVTAAVVHFKQRSNSSGYCIPSTNKSITVNIAFMKRDWNRGTDRGSLWAESEPWNYSNRARKTINGIENYDGIIQKTFTQADNGFWTADITDIVDTWYRFYKEDGVHPNYGLILFNDHEDFTASDSNFGFDIYSIESSLDNRPYITYTLTSNSPPNEPANVSPRGSHVPPLFTTPVVTTATPRFYGELDDPDPSDWISAYQVRVVSGGPAEALMWDSGRVTTSGKPKSVSVVYGSVVGTGSYYPPQSLVGQNGSRLYLTPYWIMRFWDSAGNVGPYLSPVEFFIVNTPPNTPTTTIIEQPVLDLTTLTPRVQITHNDPDPYDTRMFGYELSIVETLTSIEAYDSDRIDRSDSPITSVTLTVPVASLEWGTAYKVSAATKDRNGSWSQFSTVNIQTHKTGTPINLTPAESAVVPTSPTFSAQRVNSFENITSYDLVVYSDDLSTQMLPETTFTDGINNGASITKAYSGASLQSGSFYKWKIRFTSSIGGTSDWSDLLRFKVASDASIPTPTAPIGVTADLTPTFQGARATAFNRFKYEIYPVTATGDNPGTYIYASGSITQASSTSFSTVYGGSPALDWSTTYKWRVAVSSDAGVTWSTWSDMASFSTPGINPPDMSLATPGPDEWLATAPTSFSVPWNGTDTMDRSQIQVYTTGNILLWDSGMVNLTDGTSQTITYDSGGSPSPAPTLTPGGYYWIAKYRKTGSPAVESRYSAPSFFRVNSPPDAPSNMFPTPSYVYADTLLPNFEANFSDADTDLNDTPTEWRIELTRVDGGTFSGGGTTVTKILDNDTTDGLNNWDSGDPIGLVIGKNDYQWQELDTALEYSIDYKYRTYFVDSQGATGIWSGYNQFRLAESPSATITAPTNGTNVNVTTPTITWSYSGSTVQQRFTVHIVHVDENGAYLNENMTQSITSALHTYTVPTAKLRANRYYSITLTVTSADGLSDPDPETVQVYVALDAPDPITGLAPHVDEDNSKIDLTWTRPVTLKNSQGQHYFSAYYIYRKLPGDDDWTRIASTNSIDSTSYTDWYARQGVAVLYRITIATTKTHGGVEFESPDDSFGGNIAQVTLDTDQWFIVGYDRAESHIYTLPVTDESHTRVIQQESFEPLGASRKVIIRGFVLGTEGSLTATYVNRPDLTTGTNMTITGRRLVDYLVDDPGPHTLKSPFGDVWDVQFEGPEMRWLPGGNLEFTANWTETGLTPVEEL